MDETEVLQAGISVMNKLCDGEYDAVYDLLREDVRESTSAQTLREVMETAADDLGEAGEVTDTLITGVTDKDTEPHAIAVIRRKYEKKSIYFRIAFDTEMKLIGLEAKKK